MAKINVNLVRSAAFGKARRVALPKFRFATSRDRLGALIYVVAAFCVAAFAWQLVVSGAVGAEDARVSPDARFQPRPGPRAATVDDGRFDIGARFAPRPGPR
jgi:hypothetical protein